jgi:putative endonuclease
VAPSTTDRGGRGEATAARFLKRAGYRIVERNFRCKAGELDIVARDGETLVFVEVRTRATADYGSALETVGAAKQAQIAKIARIYLHMRKPTFDECRFDVVGITAGELEHVKGAFRVG